MKLNKKYTKGLIKELDELEREHFEIISLQMECFGSECIKGEMKRLKQLEAKQEKLVGMHSGQPLTITIFAKGVLTILKNAMEEK